MTNHIDATLVGDDGDQQPPTPRRMARSIHLALARLRNANALLVSVDAWAAMQAAILLMRISRRLCRNGEVDDQIAYTIRSARAGRFGLRMEVRDGWDSLLHTARDLHDAAAIRPPADDHDDPEETPIRTG